MTAEAATFFRGHVVETAELVTTLLEEGACTRVHVYNNDPTPGWEVNFPGAVTHDAPDWTLTEMWNASWLRCEADYLAILNNDIIIPDTFIAPLAAALDADPDLWVVCPDYNLDVTDDSHPHGVQRIHGLGAAVGGLSGWAFMVRVSIAETIGWPPIDPRLRWWYGDNDLVESVRHHGGAMGMVLGLPVDHELSMTWRDRPELHPLVEQDRVRFNERWSYR